MNGYKCFYDRKSVDIYADTPSEAKQKAIAHFKAPRSKQWMISVVLCELAGQQVTISTASL
jgi:hypothetical protein